MLRASALQTGRPFDLAAIVHADRDPRLPAGVELLDFGAAVVDRHDQVSTARERLMQVVGVAGTVRAAAVAANFQMMNRLVDATGVPIRRSLRAIADELELNA